MLGLWAHDETRTGFTLYVCDDNPSSISWCNREWFEENGYDIVEFSDLAKEIDESEMSLDVLLG